MDDEGRLDSFFARKVYGNRTGMRSADQCATYHLSPRSMWVLHAERVPRIYVPSPWSFRNPTGDRDRTGGTVAGEMKPPV